MPRPPPESQAPVPSAPTRAQAFGAQLRVQTVQRDGKSFYHFHGVASTVEQPYRMYDWYGEYDEVVDAGAFDKTLGAGPDVAFLLNHAGTTIGAHEVGNARAERRQQRTHLRRVLQPPERSDVADLAPAIGDGDIDEMSFAFRIVRGEWSPDYTQYRILEVDLDRGDVSASTTAPTRNTSISAAPKPGPRRRRRALRAVPPRPRARANERLSDARSDAAAAAPAAQPAPPAVDNTAARVGFVRRGVAARLSSPTDPLSPSSTPPTGGAVTRARERSMQMTDGRAR